MSIDEITEFLGGFAGVLILRPLPGDGSPEISWGDSFFYYAPVDWAFRRRPPHGRRPSHALRAARTDRSGRRSRPSGPSPSIRTSSTAASSALIRPSSPDRTRRSDACAY